MGAEDHVVEGEQRVVRRWRLLVEDVETGACDRARGEGGIGGGRFVDDAAAAVMT